MTAPLDFSTATDAMPAFAFGLASEHCTVVVC